MLKTFLCIAASIPFILSATVDDLTERMTLANSEPGVRYAPERSFSVPTDEVSPEIQALIKGPYFSVLLLKPKDAEEWKELVNKYTLESLKELPAIKEKFGVTVTPKTIAGVSAFLIEPKFIPEKNKNRLLVHVHGGGYVFSPGEVGTLEGILMASFGGFKVLSVDYRMPPDHPYPAALDDAMSVWKEAVKMADPKNMAIFGASTGGGLTLAMILRAKDEHLPLPAAIAASTPWSDLTEAGDSYQTNEWLDNVLISWKGLISSAADLYANGHDLKNPYLSPIYGDFTSFPPTTLITGTRDLFLSNTIRVHRKLRRAGVEADLNVYEGQSHGQFMMSLDAPETKEAFIDIANFFDKHLGK